MLDVHVDTAANRAAYQDHMEVCFRWRHRIYVEEKHWMPPRPRELEIDEFDTDDATYLLAFRDETFVAGSRLRPFSTPTLLADVFPHLVANAMPCEASEAEWTRMFVVPGARGRSHQGVAGAMCCAVMEFCLEAGVTRLGGIQETYWLPRWADFGWRVEPLGLPQEVDGTPCIAALFDVSPAAFDQVCEVAGVRRRQLVQLGPHRDFVTGRILPPTAPEFRASPEISRPPKVLS